MASEAFNQQHSRVIVARLIIEKRTWVNRVTSWEKTCLCRAGLMSLNLRKDHRGKSLYGSHPIYLWAEAGRKFLDDIRAELLAQEAA